MLLSFVLTTFYGFFEASSFCEIIRFIYCNFLSNYKLQFVFIQPIFFVKILYLVKFPEKSNTFYDLCSWVANNGTSTVCCPILIFLINFLLPKQRLYNTPNTINHSPSWFADFCFWRCHPKLKLCMVTWNLYSKY